MCTNTNMELNLQYQHSIDQLKVSLVIANYVTAETAKIMRRVEERIKYLQVEHKFIYDIFDTE